MACFKKLWFTLGIIVVLSFSVVGYLGRKIYQEAPPIPTQVLTTKGHVVFSKDDIQKGQSVWQSVGGQELGTIWGHGSYLAPDWGADWLHKQAIYLLDLWAKRDFKKAYEQISLEQKSALQERLKKELRTNTYNPSTDTITISSDVAASIQHVSKHYTALFSDNHDYEELRNKYSMMRNTILLPQNRDALCAFFFWVAWTCVTERPGENITYTNNWPAERLVGNTPPAALILVSVLSVVLLLAGIGAMCWYYANNLHMGTQDNVNKTAPISVNVTPSMLATKKYFLTVALLIILQIIFGVITAHYSVEGNEFFGLRIGELLPYTATRTWHVQLALFWIATSLLGAGLYIAPYISGYEPPFQKLAVNFLWVCLVVIVLGSMLGEWLGIQQMLSLTTNYFFGHQGYQYVDLGRFWQAFLMVGLVLWFILMMRALWPSLIDKSQNRSLMFMFCISAFTITSFYAAGFMWGQHTNLAIVEYWRWWVVHLWVEGIFEIFTTTAIAFLFTQLGLLQKEKATKTVLLATVIYSFGGILGIFHHLYFTATPQAVIVIGGIFSALEVVPLSLMGFEAYHNYRLTKERPWVKEYKWPIYFFIAVSFWNLVGAGLFGFLINMPSVLYYSQGLNTTPLHAHAALYGVYGNLSIGLLLFCLHGLQKNNLVEKSINKIAAAFWTLNIGIAAMCFLSLMPVGLLQLWTSITKDMWYARSELFTAQPLVHTLVWLRAFGDVLFGVGALYLLDYVIRLYCNSCKLIKEKS